ncbi:MAG: hypothetical protein KC505_06615 [Myxococcales bacterium]|nr:hypothetical protein [Myxococcales bacterium]USN50743.1 MAG: hypothetical protein H6731_10880 [Myxococcales bacterium]
MHYLFTVTLVVFIFSGVSFSADLGEGQKTSLKKFLEELDELEKKDLEKHKNRQEYYSRSVTELIEAIKTGRVSYKDKVLVLGEGEGESVTYRGLGIRGASRVDGLRSPISINFYDKTLNKIVKWMFHDDETIMRACEQPQEN